MFLQISKVDSFERMWVVQVIHSAVDQHCHVQTTSNISLEYTAVILKKEIAMDQA